MGLFGCLVLADSYGWLQMKTERLLKVHFESHLIRRDWEMSPSLPEISLLVCPLHFLLLPLRSPTITLPGFVFLLTPCQFVLLHLIPSCLFSELDPANLFPPDLILKGFWHLASFEHPHQSVPGSCAHAAVDMTVI